MIRVQSLNLDFVFDKVYDFMLSIKYFWYFTLLNQSEEEYLLRIKDMPWDGLRDRQGWLSIKSNADQIVQNAKEEIPIIYNPNNNYGDTGVEQLNVGNDIASHYTFEDKVRSFFGFGIKDSDKDGLPDSYETAKGYNKISSDTDSDGLSDMDEIKLGTNPVGADTDADGVIDGRDYYPMDKSISVSENDIDSDADGVGDAVEKYLGSNHLSSDTDIDGAPDSYDASILGDGQSYFGLPDLAHITTPSLSLEIKNSFLLFVGQILGVLYILIIPIFIYVMYNWYKQIKSDVDHYEHLFHNAFGYDEVNLSSHSDSDHAKIDDMLTVLSDHKKSLLVSDAENSLHHEARVVEVASEINEEKNDFKVVWDKIELAANSEVEDERKMAIMQADNLLDDLLIKRGYMGQSMGDRLSQANFKTIDIAWDVHKLRNRVAHGDTSVSLSDREARKAILMYEVVFKDLNIL